MRKKLGFAAVWVVAGLALARADAPASGGVAKLVADLSGGDVKARSAAYERADRFGPAAIGRVAALLDHTDPAVVRAAKIALEKIVGPSTRQESGCRAASAALCGALKTVKSRAGRDWLLWLLSYAGTPDAVTAILPLLDDPESADSALLALQGIGANPAACELVGGALGGRLPGTAGNLRAGILDVLGAIGGKAAVSALLVEAAKPEPECVPALEALGRLGVAAAKDLILAKIKAGDPAPEMVDAYIRIAAKQPPRTAAAMYRDLLQIAGSPNTTCAALQGLGKSGAAADVAAILPYLGSDRADIFGAAKEALVAARGKAAVKAMTDALAVAEPPVKSGVLEVLSTRSMQHAIPFLEKASEDANEEVRATAIGLLGRTGDAKYEAKFLDQAQSGPDAVKPVALRAYLNLAEGALAKHDLEKALAMYHTALPLAIQDAERVAALSGIARVADPRSLPVVEAQAGNPAVAGPLVACYLAIADKLKAADSAQAIALYTKVVEMTSDLDAAQRAAEGLRGLGAAVDFARRRGFIINWKLIGPFPNTGFDAVYPPETEFDPTAEYDAAGAQKAKWIDYQVPHVMGVTDLAAVFNPKDSVIAYARAEVEVAEAQDVLLKIGSDDGVICWVNGEKIHANDVGRGLTVDQDVVAAKLIAGKNVILVKIVQGGGDWAFCVRLCKPDGSPMPLGTEGP
ncbi:MAG: hypothetical protein HXY20_04560 [Acidobacteria bacterium]|nr:hypothetical protein [Acidobacteriota bacterium]